MSAFAESQSKLKPMSCLVIQLSDTGDTIRDLMALKAAKQLYPGLELHFVVKEESASAVKRVSWINQVHVLPYRRMLAPVLRGEVSECGVLGDFARWIKPLVQSRWDFVVNWSYSEASSYLAALIPAKVKLGYSRRKDLTACCADDWSLYVQTIANENVEQNIHMTDILTTQLLTELQINAGDPVEVDNAPVTSKNFFELELGERDEIDDRLRSSKRWIGIHLGADKHGSSWSADGWTRLASQILSKNDECNIVLLGDRCDVSAAQRFQEYLRELVPGGDETASRIISLVGKTDFDLLASVIGRCSWLISENHTAIQLACVLGTRVLVIVRDTNGNNWFSNGPYGNHHIVVETQQAEPDAVYAAWSYIPFQESSGGFRTLETHFAELNCSHLLETMSVFKSRIRPVADGGGVVYESLLAKPLSLKEWSATVMGQVARLWYCGWVFPVGFEIERKRINSLLLKDLRKLKDKINILLNLCIQAEQTSKSLSLLATGLRSDRIMSVDDRAKVSEFGNKLKELDGSIKEIGESTDPLKAFSMMSQVMMHHLKGKKLSELADDSARAYQRLAAGVRVMKDWLDHTLTLAKPVALKKAPVMELHP